MPATNNKEAPEPDRALIASLLPSVTPPKAVLTPDGHLLKKAAQTVLAKLFNLCAIANALGSIYCFGEGATGIAATESAGFSSSKTEQWKYDPGCFYADTQRAGWISRVHG